MSGSFMDTDRQFFFSIELNKLMRWPVSLEWTQNISFMTLDLSLCHYYYYYYVKLEH